MKISQYPQKKLNIIKPSHEKKKKKKKKKKKIVQPGKSHLFIECIRKICCSLQRMITIRQVNILINIILYLIGHFCIEVTTSVYINAFFS